MKRNDIFHLLCLLPLLVASCAVPVSYLPEHDMIGEEYYGGYIEIKTLSGSDYAGELIAVQDTVLIVREEIMDISSSFLVAKSNIKSYSIRYANGKEYGWHVLLYTLGTVSHGLWLIFSAPVNLIATGIIAADASIAYQQDDRTLSYQDLAQFARFPQGLPEGITIDMVK